ncbi:MAG: sporulation protein [Oscillospiraceae bacterium]|nr:sporulation protein [Oscillospiraceae bacterium]
MKSIWRLLPLLCLLFVAAGLVCFPKDASAGALEGLRLCGSAVIPALLPFFVISRLFVTLRIGGRSGKRADFLMRSFFGVSGSCAPALLISFVGGYPVGVSTLVSLYQSGRVSKQDAQRALVFCNNSGPAFFVGIVGGTVFGNVKIGLILYLIHCLTALLAGALTAQQAAPLLRVHRSEDAQRAPFAQVFLRAISDSCAALLQICTLVVFFSSMLYLLRNTGILQLLCTPLRTVLPQSAAQSLLSGSMELSTGILSISALLSRELAFVLCAFMLGWGGLCVHFQAMSLWQPAGLHPQGYFLQKLLHGLLSALFALAYSRGSAALLCLCGAVFALAVTMPRLRKKRASNSKVFAV